MRVVVSITWPWAAKPRPFTPVETVAHLIALGVNEVCLRTPEYLKPYGPSFHRELAELARASGIDVSLWPIVSLAQPPKLMAASIRAEAKVFKPCRIYLDVEGKWVSRPHSNPVSFLQELGKLDCPVGLGATRRPSAHPEVEYDLWLTTKVDDVFVIDFQAPQLYPIGFNTPIAWVASTEQDVKDIQRANLRAGRGDIEWLPFLATFVGGGYEGQKTPWVPKADSLKAQVDFLQKRLGDRLRGVNFWSLDKNLVRLPDVYAYVQSLSSSAASGGKKP